MYLIFQAESTEYFNKLNTAESTEPVEVLALIEYVTTYFKEQLETLSYSVPVRPALALRRV